VGLSRLQVAQAFLLLSLALAAAGSVVLLVGPITVGVFCVSLHAIAAAIGCYIYAATKGYPGLLGLPIGVGLRVTGALLIFILPDQTEDKRRERLRRLARAGLKPSRRRDPGYEVLDPDPSPLD